jgi:hypothetical protein
MDGAANLERESIAQPRRSSSRWCVVRTERETSSWQEHVEEALENRATFTAAEAGAWPPQHAAALAHVALRCAEERRRRRPALTEVLPELEALCETALASQVSRSAYSSSRGLHPLLRLCACSAPSLPPSLATHTLKREAATQEEAAGSAEQADQEDAVCVVCMDLPNTHAFVPCGHRCVCAECSEPILQSSARCPVCRAHVTQAIKIF